MKRNGRHRACRAQQCTRGSGGAQGNYILWRHWKTMPLKRIYKTLYTYFKSGGERDALSKDVQKHVELLCFWDTTALRWVKLRGKQSSFYLKSWNTRKDGKVFLLQTRILLLKKDMTGTISLSWKRYTCQATVKALITFQDLIKRALEKLFLPCMKHTLKKPSSVLEWVSPDFLWQYTILPIILWEPASGKVQKCLLEAHIALNLIG